MPGLLVAGLAGIGTAVELAHFDASAANLPAPSAGSLTTTRFFDPAGTDTPSQTAKTRPSAAAASRADAESRLMTVFELLDRHLLDDALQASLSLADDQPNFKLAHLVRATLLSARAARTVAGAQPAGPEAEALDGLLLEARRRLQAWHEPPPAGALPAELLQVPPSITHALAIDASRSRLYVFKNGPTGLQLVDDIYVSVGKNGVGKSDEGDLRTPLGVYFTTDLFGARLLDTRLGTSALPLNYPNAYDRRHRRGGRGILLHGVPADTYVRPPHDSDGCIAMANDDLERLTSELPKRMTPVVIARELHWTDRQALPRTAPPDLLQAIHAWQKARVDGDTDKALSYYDKLPVAADPKLLASLRQGPLDAPDRIDDISLLTTKVEQDVVVVTFTETGAPALQTPRVVRQYWAQRGTAWRIQAEGLVL